MKTHAGIDDAVAASEAVVELLARNDLRANDAIAALFNAVLTIGAPICSTPKELIERLRETINVLEKNMDETFAIYDGGTRVGR